VKYKIINLLILLGLTSNNMFASNQDDVSLHGYGTVGIAYQDNEDVLYRNSINTKKGSRGDLSFANYSSFGLQLDVPVSEKISLTTQGIVSENTENHLELSWLNAKYQLDDDSSIRIGKMRLPTFMYSDILNVSYSYDWVRLPDMYSLIPLNSYTGIELNHDMEFNNLSIMATALYGQSKNTLYHSSNEGIIEESDANADDLYIIKLKFLYDDFTFRVGYSKFLFTLSNKKLDSVLAQLNSLNIPIVTQAVNQYKIKDTSVKYLEIGARYDFEKSYVVGEYLKYSNNSFLPNNTSWYVGTGYNFENWSPFILYSTISSSQNYKDIKPQEGTPIEISMVIDGANQVLSQISKNGVNVELETLSLGFRYNLSENSILKLQYDRQQETKENRLNFHYSNDKKVDLNIFSTTVSFVF
jgi:predicted porin